MNRLLVVLVSVAVLTGTQLAGQIKGESLQGKGESLQGAWQAVEVNFTGPAAHTLVIPEPRPTLMIFSARHYSRVTVETSEPRPVLSDVSKASADQLRAAWGPVGAEAGTYKLTGTNEITMRPIAAKNPAAMAPGSFTTYSFKMEGDTLWATQQRNQHGAFAHPVTIKLVRVE
jgi:hypothetical protein